MRYLLAFTVTIGAATVINLVGQSLAQAATVFVSEQSDVRPSPTSNAVLTDLPVDSEIEKNIAQSLLTESSVPPAWQVETLPDIANPPAGKIETAIPNAPVWTEVDSTAPTVASIAPIPSPVEVEALQSQLENFAPAPQRWSRRYKASPGITLGVPSGFGADRGRRFFGIGLQRTRISTNDGAAGIGLGLGDARKGIGVQISYTSTSISPAKLLGRNDSNNFNASARPFGSGGFNLKVHRQFPGGVSVAAGADSIVSIGPRTAGVSAASVNGTVQNEFEGTYYIAATKLFKLKPDATEPFSRLAVTFGAGTGRFQPTQTLVDGKTIITPFGSVALKTSVNTSFIAEWTGQDFGVGLSWVPFRNLPIVITPGFRDLFGPDAKRPRFVLGVGTSF